MTPVKKLIPHRYQTCQRRKTEDGLDQRCGDNVTMDSVETFRVDRFGFHHNDSVYSLQKVCFLFFLYPPSATTGVGLNAAWATRGVGGRFHHLRVTMRTTVSNTFWL
ncbi:unnamed protein product [Macrosiphum euphorbiae]|uniref:Uncharacterized protein n=1 Tax=Macrosiphum euphorbiae TaxID=13131 RepID=A0AAV0X2H8_9HEMI|nr:unnamed protein product [Macrosiphum euphorbiae]